ncbi:uncharacterized protein LOC128505724 [Clarias gariepinus]|uniref:uncharacterized protein LOC128505724 n=1 Tax=Clarias gariepinus TaxID=13013 RepID=UPI00234D5C8F|nr:uncharacterized protein LOC128505724 [Clarias gariepinus]
MKDKKKSSFCSYNILNNDTHDHKCGLRFKVNTGLYGLNITYAESSDAGVYNCVMTRVIPPPSVERYLTLSLKVLPSPTLQLINNTNSSCVDLICSLQGLSPQQVNFTWTRASQLLHHQVSSSTNSSLMLCIPNWTEGETLTCQASYSHNHILSKSITLPYKSSWTVCFIVVGISIFLLFSTALSFEVYGQCLIANHHHHLPSSAAEHVSPSQVSFINSTN